MLFRSAKLTGSDTLEVLMEMGYEQQELEDMMERGDISDTVITVK